MSLVHYPTASLKPRKEESLLGGHLWIFSGALQQPPRWIELGGLVDVKSSTGQFVARGYYNPHTDIAIRILTHDENEAIDQDFLRRRIRSALALREVFDPQSTNAYRLIHSEGDELPGLVVDRYANILVVQIHTAGMERLRPLIIESLVQETGASGILLRNDSQSRRREELPVEEPVVVAGEVPASAEILSTVCGLPSISGRVRKLVCFLISATNVRPFASMLVRNASSTASAILEAFRSMRL